MYTIPLHDFFKRISLKKTSLEIPVIFSFVLLFFFSTSFCQSAGINTNGTTDPNAMFEIRSSNKGILIPRIDFNNRPVNVVQSGTLIFVTQNGPDGNNTFYYYNGSAWVRVYRYNENQQISLSNDSLYISPTGNHVYLGNIFPVSGYIKCGSTYINPLTNNNNCGTCGNVCPVGTTCKNGSCQ